MCHLPFLSSSSLSGPIWQSYGPKSYPTNTKKDLPAFGLAFIAYGIANIVRVEMWVPNNDMGKISLHQFYCHLVEIFHHIFHHLAIEKDTSSWARRKALDIFVWGGAQTTHGTSILMYWGWGATFIFESSGDTENFKKWSWRSLKA